METLHGIALQTMVPVPRPHPQAVTCQVLSFLTAKASGILPRSPTCVAPDLPSDCARSQAPPPDLSWL